MNRIINLMCLALAFSVGANEVLPIKTARLKISALYWPGQQIKGSSQKAAKLGYYELKDLMLKNPVARLTDGKFAWKNSVATYFWGNQPKRIEVIMDLGQVCQVDQVQVFQGATRQKGNLIEKISVAGALDSSSQDHWDTPQIQTQKKLAAATNHDAYPVNFKLHQNYRYLKIVCESRRSAIMVLSEIKIWGAPLKGKLALPPVPPETARFELEQIPGVFLLKKAELLGGSGAFVTRTHQVDLAIPEKMRGKKIYTYLRYLDNGSKKIEFAVNGQAQEMPSTRGRWQWRPGPVILVRGDIVAVSLRHKGKENGLVDALLLTTDAKFNPAQVDQPMFLKKLPQLLIKQPFAIRLLKSQPQISPAEFARRVAQHHQIKLQPPTPAVDQNNNLLYQGRPFFPLGFYHVSPHDPRLGKIKLNTFITSRSDLTLKKDQALVISHLASLRAYDELAERLKKFSRDQVVMHYISDEPDGHINTTVRDLELLTALVKAICPHQVTFINFAANSTMHQAFRITDAVGLDHYPVPAGRIADIAYTMDAMRYFSGNRPVVFVPQAFSWKGYGVADGRYPTADELRAMTILSLVHGAKGLLFYEFPAPRLSSKTAITQLNPALWQAITQLVDQLTTIQAALLGPDWHFPGKIKFHEAQRGPEFRLLTSADRQMGIILGVNPWNEKNVVQLDFSQGSLRNLTLAPQFSSGAKIKSKPRPGVFELEFSPFGTLALQVKNANLAQLKVRTTPELLQELKPIFAPPAGHADHRLKLDGTPLDLLDSWGSLKRPERAQLTADRQGLKLDVVLRFPAGSRSRCQQRDGRVWSDPALEIFLGYPNHPNYIHLMVNTNNVQADWKFSPNQKQNVNKAVNYKWLSQVDYNGERAHFKVQIPWTTLQEMTQVHPGEILTFNLASSLGFLDWAGLTGSGYHAPARFRRIKLDNL